MTVRDVINFKGEKERAYQQFFLKQDLVACRAISYLVVLVMLILSVLDFFRVADMSWVLFSRIIVCLAFGILIYLTHRVNFTPIHLQVTLLSLNLVFLTSVFFMDAMTVMPPFFLTNSICAFLFVAVTISGLWFRWGGLLNAAVVLAFLFYFPYSVNSAFHKSQIANVSICLTISLLIGLVWERNKRVMFLQHAQMNSLLNIFSHDMVSPFNSLLGLLNLNENHAINGKDFETNVNSIKKATANNVLLLQNLVKWSKSQMEGFRPNLERVNLDEIIVEAVDLLQSTAQGKDVTLQYQRKEAHCLADSEMVKLIIRNVISNGIKFSKPRGIVDISALQNHAFISVCIKDDGIGMSTDEMATLFDHQVKSKSGTYNEKGSGIGLYITKQFVSLNNGNIGIESAVGKGSTVKINFPIGVA